MLLLIMLMNAAVKMLAQHWEDFLIYFVYEITDSPPNVKVNENNLVFPISLNGDQMTFMQHQIDYRSVCRWFLKETLIPEA